MKLKYIIDRFGRFMIFSESVVHADAARLLEYDIVGAGFIFIDQDGANCYGESISCRVKSRKIEDSAIINKALGFHTTN